MNDSNRPAWVADPRIGWRILLTAELPAPADPAALTVHLAKLASDQRWPALPAPRADDSLDRLQAALLAPHAEPLLVGVSGRHLVLSAHHSAVDGLSLLTVLGRLGLAPVTSAARGVGDRTTTGGVARTVGRRLGEVAFRPPAAVTPPSGPVPEAGDVLVESTVRGSHRTAAIVAAAARAVVDHEAARGRAARHVAVAVGAVREQKGGGAIGDHSVLLRLRDVERLDTDGIAAALAQAPVQTPPVSTEPRPWTPLTARATRTGLRLLAPRLGSTLLVSHLGEVTAPHVDRLVFHPVTAGGSGISLGAVGLRGDTVLTLRARAASWNDDGLEQLLEAIISLLREESGASDGQ
ncbi:MULTISPECIES: hypothetical protein [unclassified Nocardioides]|uniref:hypothetical protein n=1 Tax=unclassified Nocardioides TaxID=2615069 RepID=UPI0006F485ED|nr:MULTISPECIES: hypothetical protein [unclassified Nocardioides]KRA37314.1 hypothetical protein ASD81_00810 [Nocardioides sp. Root614]KRA91275.1 hypothetical protein ASD84_01075 [Nocardioides sp. Root682]